MIDVEIAVRGSVGAVLVPSSCLAAHGLVGAALVPSSCYAVIAFLSDSMIWCNFGCLDHFGEAE